MDYELILVIMQSGLKPLECWICGFESHWRHGCLSFVFVLCCI